MSMKINNFFNVFVLLIICIYSEAKIQSRLPADGPLYKQRRKYLFNF